MAFRPATCKQMQYVKYHNFVKMYNYCKDTNLAQLIISLYNLIIILN